MNNFDITKLSIEEKKEQLTSEYLVMVNYPVNITDRVHEAAAKRFGLTYDECAECLQQALILKRENSKRERMAGLTEDLKTMLKYGIQPASTIELLKAQKIWELSHDEVQECMRDAIASATDNFK